jgi:hypothetical protein
MVVYHVIVLPAVYVLGPVLARDELGGPGAWAAIVATFGAGSIVGDLLLLRWRPARPLRVAAGALALASCQAAAYGSGLPLGAVCAIQFAAAIGVTACFTLWETTLQEHVPPASLSRVSSYDYMVTVGLMPLGTVIAGPVADAVGLHTTLRAMSVVGVLAACGLLGVRSVRTLGRGQTPAPTPVAPGTA